MLFRSIRESSEREAALIIREARAQGEADTEDARSEIRKLEQHLAELERARRSHLTQMRVAVERHLAEITAAENAPAPQIPSLSRDAGATSGTGVAERA